MDEPSRSAKENLMRIPVIGVTISMGAFLCGCATLAIFLDDGCGGAILCPDPSVSYTGGQCTTTYYQGELLGPGAFGCRAYPTTHPCQADTSTPPAPNSISAPS